MSKTENSPSDTDAAAPVSPTPATDKGPDKSGTQDKSKVDLATAAIKSAGKGVWAGAAVGIGSAAIVAALLYTRKKG
ncbi:hypothetical protein U5A82_14210 [Sphingobium sp. CR2-8]|uniref:hypothetical protein n=1 Tax=Sphingobium sp. CR2-8 TaxID=1306534 RepID=UPI002DBE8556|nr:hypothetical protein [Sphingobium sp. CR2-8]MEC3911577.1 hypothetical protein [Sphingobium sp. CR2-8]